jgi:hypothetical protein
MVVLDEHHPLSICQIRIFPSSHKFFDLLFEKNPNHAYYMPTLHLVKIFNITFCFYNYLNQRGVKMMHLSRLATRYWGAT